MIFFSFFEKHAEEWTDNPNLFKGGNGERRKGQSLILENARLEWPF
jgi:hypothetical protein